MIGQTVTLVAHCLCMIKAIAIDLDDTLLDTSGLLAPRATQDAFVYLINNGLKLSLAECEALRLELIKTISHRDTFEKLAFEYGDENTKKVLAETIRLFYEPLIPPRLPMLEGARENIDYLKSRYQLYLVTAGTESAQMNKIKSLGIEADFKKIYVVNSLLKKRKKDAFNDIINKQKIVPAELLCIGNSVLSEIADALEIQALACYFEYGENRGEISSLPRSPHFHIKHHRELIATCQL